MCLMRPEPDERWLHSQAVDQYANSLTNIPVKRESVSTHLISYPLFSSILFCVNGKTSLEPNVTCWRSKGIHVIMFLAWFANGLAFRLDFVFRFVPPPGGVKKYLCWMDDKPRNILRMAFISGVAPSKRLEQTKRSDQCHMENRRCVICWKYFCRT